MKVLYFHQYFTTPSIGGGIRSYEFAQQLMARGHQVTMVCGGRNTKFDLQPTQKKNIFRGNVDGIDVLQIALPYSNKDGLIKRSMTFIRFALKGIRITSKEEYDLIFTTSTPLTAGIPGIFAKKRGKKFVFEVRDLWPELPKALGLKNPFMLWGMRILEKKSYRKANGCIGLSPGICDGIRKKAQKNKPIIMIPNGCDLDIFHPNLRKTIKLNGVNQEDKIAVFTGAHGVANGLDAILDMTIELKKLNRDDIKILFIGEGKVKPHLQERVEKEDLNNCLFFDPVSKLELNNIIASANLGLMVLKNVPAFYYGTSPNKFFDYIASGIPVVNNYPGWIADLIQDNNCGEVVPPENPKAFADAVIRLADNPRRCMELGANARKLAEKEFSRELLSNKFVDFLEHIMSI